MTQPERIAPRERIATRDVQRPKITIFDYGAGNLHSLAKALMVEGVDIRIESDPVAVVETDALVLPGVGAFQSAAERLAPGRDAMREAILTGLPTLGICLGMQLLFEKSEEGTGTGLGVIPGRVRKLAARRVPQIGWNDVEARARPSTDGTTDGTTGALPAAVSTALPRIAYFANSYVCDPEDSAMIIADTTHETDRFASAVAVANTVGVQFHPEKSSAAGVAFVHRFVHCVKNRSLQNSTWTAGVHTSIHAGGGR